MIPFSEYKKEVLIIFYINVEGLTRQQGKETMNELYHCYSAEYFNFQTISAKFIWLPSTENKVEVKTFDSIPLDFLESIQDYIEVIKTKKKLIDEFNSDISKGIDYIKKKTQRIKKLNKLEK